MTSDESPAPAAGGRRRRRGVGKRDEQRYEDFVWAVARGATHAEAAAAAGIARTTAMRWAKSAGFDTYVAAAANDSVAMLRKRAFELAMGGNIRLLIWLLEHRGVIGEREDGGPDGPPAEHGPAGVVEVEIVGLERRDADDGESSNSGGGGGRHAPAEPGDAGGAFIEFVEDDGGGVIDGT